MQVEEYESWIRAEEEQVARHLFDSCYEELPDDICEWIHSRVVVFLWSKYAHNHSVAAA
jgi:hypothetical protein